MSKIFQFLIFVFLLFFINSRPIIELKEIESLYDDMAKNVKQNKLRRYMIFEINTDEVKDPDHFSRIIVDFFLSNGFQNGAYNVLNKFYIVYLSKEDEIKIQTVRDYFGAAFNKIYWFNKKNPDHNFVEVSKKILKEKNDL